MTGLTGVDGVTLQGILRMENELFSCLQAVRSEVAHAECFDEEQRAEVYTILKSLSDNTAGRCAMLSALAAGRPS